ncbi:MAG: hypothetical protein ACHQKY_17530 [Terriglobia bacterium]
MFLKLMKENRSSPLCVCGLPQVLGLLTFFLLAADSVSFGEEFTLRAKHDHLKGSCSGELTVSDNGIRYQTTHLQDQRQWAFADIQEVQIISEKKLNVISYEDSRKRLGGDKIFKFELQGETLPSNLIALVESKFAKPISNRLAAENLKGQFEIPVKHLHRVGGCQGKLIITEIGISFVSEKPGESRQWRYSDLQTVASTERYELRLGTYEHGPLQYADTKEFRFQLKEPLSEVAYRSLWARINQLPQWRPEGSGKFAGNSER